LPGDDVGFDRERVRTLLVPVMREAGALALKTFRQQPKSWIKGKSSPVTEADLAVNALLSERLLAIQDAGWLSEETEDDLRRLERRVVWVVDPIDGTRAYLAAIEPRIEPAARVPSLALRLARVASGALDGTFAAPNSCDWDLAAADLLVHEAGGALTTLTGELLIYNRPDPVHPALLGAGCRRHAVLLRLIRDRLAEFA